MAGSGRECGSVNCSPAWSCRSSNPASTLAARENGEVLTSPWSQTSDLAAATGNYVSSDIIAIGTLGMQHGSSIGIVQDARVTIFTRYP